MIWEIDDNGIPEHNGIPFFGKNGGALSSEERATIAKRKGVCLRCGEKTHIVKVFRRTAITNNDVHSGTCIRCNEESVPSNIFADWQARNPSAKRPGTSNRFANTGTAHDVRYAVSSHPPHPKQGDSVTANGDESVIVDEINNMR
jgi:hypothetical protein